MICFLLTQVLLEQAREKKVKKMNAYELLREKVIKFLHETLKKYLDSRPSEWIFNDIFYFDDVNTIKKMLMGAPRNVVQLALKTPYHYLKVIDCENKFCFKILLCKLKKIQRIYEGLYSFLGD